MTTGLLAAAALAITVAAMTAVVPFASGGTVTYDGRSLIIGGQRKILFSGSIHYPRSTPAMWPSLIDKAKQGGLDVIQTYVFWNVHEPAQGQYDFQGRYDLVAFIKLIKAHGLYVSLRIGPFIESEWKYGGFPFWLHDVPGIIFRSDNEPFKYHMERFTTKIVNMMKFEGLYASQGGPIILSQIENEYKNVEPAFHEKGPPYVQWAARMAVGLQTGVPWIMCKQDDAPDPVINACNGMNCGETFVGPNSPNKPAIWTENWTSWFQKFGEEPFIRSAQDIAFAVALFVAKGGSFVNYYMYHGGTNFGGFAASYIITSYYDQAPLDEYGLIRQPKWGHLKELHAAVKSCSDVLLYGKRALSSLGPAQEAHVYEDSGKCAAFLSNSDRGQSATVQFRNSMYELPPRSIIILPDCHSVAFNTAKVNVRQSLRSNHVRETFSSPERWGAFADGVVNAESASFTAAGLLEQMSTTKGATDYLWYTTSYEYNPSANQPILNVNSRSPLLYAFVNGVFVGSARESATPGAILKTAIPLKNGKNYISLLSTMVGLPNAGAFLEHKVSGIQSVSVQGTNNRMVDLSHNQWAYQIGLLGEKLKIYTPGGSSQVRWTAIGISALKRLTWFKTSFDAPPGLDPVVLNLGSMGKGEVWINGESIGRYWVSLKTARGQPSQSLKQPMVDLQRLDRRTTVRTNLLSYGTSTGGCKNYAIGSSHVVRHFISSRGCKVPLIDGSHSNGA